MKYVILRTDVETERMVRTLQPVLSSRKGLYDWTVDIEDKDNVLRIVADDKVEESDIIHLLNQSGYLCEALPD